MKKGLLYFLTFFVSFQLYGQCDELFISEYVEGNQYNKAIEIYNPTNNAVDLSNYRIVRWRNGGNTFNGREVALLSGTLNACDVYVAVKDPGTTQDGSPEVVDSLLQTLADGFYNKVYNNGSAFYFNGDDGLTLEKNIGGTWTVVDLFATASGLDPGLCWGNVHPFATDSFYQCWTQDQTMVRKFTVQTGFVNYTDTTGGGSVERMVRHDNIYGVLYDAPALFNPQVEWDSFPRNYFGDLGTHECACCTVGVNDLDDVELQIYPNFLLGNNKSVTIEAELAITAVTLYNIQGQELEASLMSGVNTSETYAIPNRLNSGIYLLQVNFKNNQQAIRKLVIQK